MHARAHIKKLDDCFGQLLVRVICDCGACREIEPEALASLVGWSMIAFSSMPAASLRSRPASLGSFGAYPPLTTYWHPLNLNDAIRVLQLNEPVAL